MSAPARPGVKTNGMYPTCDGFAPEFVLVRRPCCHADILREDERKKGCRIHADDLFELLQSLHQGRCARKMGRRVEI